ncbi:M23 family metallopeptidase [Streptomyces sp. NPDC006012]|uniref:M23 family metallopeptidase n=1 Tax=Streptomyces sp. NPDC006012 TaxID=3364739 RepID=UPI0036889F5B
MRSYRCRPPAVWALLWALVVLAVPPAHAAGDGPGSGPRLGDVPAVGLQVAHLYRDAAEATRQYETGRRETEKQHAGALRADRLLGRERRRISVLHANLGRLARAQYRSGGGLPLTAQILLATGPDQLMRGQHAWSRTSLAVSSAVDSSRRAEARLAAEEARARTAWRAVRRRTTELAGLRRDIERKLATARGQLQDRADASVAAGRCHAAARLEQPRTRVGEGTPVGEAWVAPVRTYQLSAGFGRGGERWAHRHTGQDFAVPIGTPVRAAGAGHVDQVSCGGAFGIQIVIRHPGGYCTQYAHLAAVAVGEGDRVSTGQWIGQSGTTGNSTGPHLHFEVRVTAEAGSAVDPVSWLARHGVRLRGARPW